MPMSRYFITHLGIALCNTSEDPRIRGHNTIWKSAVEPKTIHPHLLPVLELWKAKIIRSLTDWYDLAAKCGNSTEKSGIRQHYKRDALAFLSSEFYDEIREFYNLPPFNPTFELDSVTKMLLKRG